MLDAVWDLACFVFLLSADYMAK